MPSDKDLQFQIQPGRVRVYGEISGYPRRIRTDIPYNRRKFVSRSRHPGNSVHDEVQGTDELLHFRNSYLVATGEPYFYLIPQYYESEYATTFSLYGIIEYGYSTQAKDTTSH